jgi:hypothetical protein
MENKPRANLAIIFLIFAALFVFFTIPGSPLSIYKLDEPVATVGSETITRGDVHFTLQLLTLGGSLAVLFLLFSDQIVLIKHG